MLYSIAGHILEICLENTEITVDNFLSFKPFEVKTSGEHKTVCRIVVDDKTQPLPKEEMRFVKDVDTGNGIIKVMRHSLNGIDIGYQFVIYDVAGNSAALLLADNSFNNCTCALKGNMTRRIYGFNSAVMLCFAFATASKSTLLVHASMVRHNGIAYAFIAKSGTGKSTQVANWLRYIPNCDLMNDDNPIFRVEHGTVMAYGSPWSGKTPCYRNVSSPLGGVAKINRNKINRLDRLNAITAFTDLLASCSMMKWDVTLYKEISATIGRIVSCVPIYMLHCLPDCKSSEVASEGMVKAYNHQVDSLTLCCSDTVSMMNTEYLSHVISLINQGKNVTIPLKGFSMNPWIVGGRDTAVLQKVDRTKLKKGDAVLAEIRPGQYVLHRILWIDKKNVQMMGDGNISPDPVIDIDCVCALVKGYYRKGRAEIEPMTYIWYQIYSKLWTNIGPFRRYLLAIYRHFIMPKKYKYI